MASMNPFLRWPSSRCCSDPWDRVNSPSFHQLGQEWIFRSPFLSACTVLAQEEPVAELGLMHRRDPGKKVGSLHTGDLLHNYAEGCLNWMENLTSHDTYSLQREGKIQESSWRAITCCQTPSDGWPLLMTGAQACGKGKLFLILDRIKLPSIKTRKYVLKTTNHFTPHNA